jgi:hypothetical protein
VAERKSLLMVALVTAAVFASACSRKSAVDTEEIRGWAKNHGYQWIEGPDEVRTEQEFFDSIDGAAQPIIDLGWKRSLFGALEKDKARLRLTVHEMLNPQAAAALLGQNVFDDTQSVVVGERAIYWDRGLFSKGIIFQKKALYCELIFEKEGKKEELLELASSLEGLIE